MWTQLACQHNLLVAQRFDLHINCQSADLIAQVSDYRSFKAKSATQSMDLAMHKVMHTVMHTAHHLKSCTTHYYTFYNI